ncbi:hypothetical protein [Crocosphaera sp.]|uniref:hypothetical protein n=1 Tax=Crocosphaera sp. TaxID=2729996 RepID=UPI003F28B8DF|nr:hypothetical protein [Crocosphaera sp.]
MNKVKSSKHQIVWHYYPYTKIMLCVFLLGFHAFYKSLINHGEVFKEVTGQPSIFWFHLNEQWLFMNYEPEEMFINELI